MFDFLIDIVPREEAISKSELGMKRRNEKNAAKREEKRRRANEEGGAGTSGGASAGEWLGGDEGE
jgi:hypothetical protein